MATLRATGVRRLTALFHQARDPIFILGPERDFAYVNPAWETFSGLASAEVLGRDCLAIENERGLAGPIGFWPTAEALAGEPSASHTLIIRPDGERLWRRVEFWPFRDSGGGDLGIIGRVCEADSTRKANDAPSRRFAVELDEVRETIRARHGESAIVGRGPRHARLLEQIAAAAQVSAPVLIVGEIGTGRRSVARLIHRRGPFSEAGFVVLDIPALVASELDSFPEDEPGTVVLHAPECLPRDVQERLLPRFEGSKARFIAVTDVDPELSLRDGRFRDDFYYAISTLVVRLAPLRERVDEVPILAQQFLEQANRRGGPRRDFAPDAIETLSLYDWPGNISELGRVVDAAYARATDSLIHACDLPAEVKGELAAAHAAPPLPVAITPLDRWLELLERRMIEAAMVRARQNKSRAAELLGISRPRLYRRIKELGIPDEGDGNGDARPN